MTVQRPQRNSRLRTWLFVAAALLAVILLAAFLNLQALFEQLGSADWTLLLSAAGCLVAGYLVFGLRWSYILRSKPGLAPAFHSNNLSDLITLMTPIPAVALRVVSIAQISPVTYEEAIPGMAVDRLLDIAMRVISLVLVTILATSRALTFVTLLLTVAIIALLLGAIILLAHNGDAIASRISSWLSRSKRVRGQRVKRFLTGLVQGLTSIGSTKRLIVALLISIIMWILFLGFQYLGWEALGVKLNPEDMLVLSLAVLVVAPPSSPAMPGVYQGVVIASLLLANLVNGETATAYAILTWVVMLVCLLVLGVWGVTRTDLRLKHLASQTQDILRKPSEEKQDQPTDPG